MSKPKENNNLETIRHSASHILASAVKILYPKVKLGIGPAIEEGFYYDFDNVTFSEEDLVKIEEKMKEIIKKDLPFKKIEVDYKKAKSMLKDEPYKLELLEDLKDEKITFYQVGDFIDLCKGPHVKSTKEITAVKLLKLASAYWKGSEKNKMLTRVYGTAFSNKEDLDNYLKKVQYAEENNHIALGKKHKLFAFFPKEIGSGLPVLLPKGAAIRQVLERFIEDEEFKRGYKKVYTPDFAKEDLYKISGHLPKYEDGMYPCMSIYNTKFRLKPMTCPMHCMIFKESPRSYKELPLRIAELAKQYRVEKSGEMSGLIRVAHFTLADSHIFCREDQVKDEVKGALDLIMYCMKVFDIKEWRARLSLKDDSDKYVKDEKLWTNGSKLLRECLKEMKVEFYEKEGEAAFYGPKIDIQMKNIYGKEDTILTVQVDYHLPKQFELEYIGEDGKKHMPVMVHRSSVGCIERTMAFLIEKYGAKFPLWLSPVQIKVLSLSENNKKATEKIYSELKNKGFRIEADVRDVTVQAKIRDAELEKFNYILVIGDKEEQNNTLAVRPRNDKPKFGVKIEDFVKQLEEEIKNKI